MLTQDKLVLLPHPRWGSSQPDPRLTMLAGYVASTSFNCPLCLWWASQGFMFEE